MSMLITPSRFGTASGGDPLFSSVCSLLPMSGVDQSTTFTDQISGRGWTPTGDAKIVTAQSPFAGGSSGSFGTGYLTTNTLADWTFLHDRSTSWTIDVWVYVNALGANRSLFGNNKGSSANTGLGVWIDATGHGRFFMTNGGLTELNWTSSTALFAAGTWYLVSVQWDTSNQGQMTYYVSGTLAATATGAGVTGTTAPSFAFNVSALGGGSLPLDGFASNFRVTKALRYSGNFTPPTGPWPTHG